MDSFLRSKEHQDLLMSEKRNRIDIRPRRLKYRGKREIAAETIPGETRVCKISKYDSVVDSTGETAPRRGKYLIAAGVVVIAFLVAARFIKK